MHFFDGGKNLLTITNIQTNFRRFVSRAPKKISVVICCLGLVCQASAENIWPYDPSPLYPFGAPNPAQTDPEARIFDPLIGVHTCTHERTDYESRKTTTASGNWVWYYDMNGFGIRDYYRFNAGAPVSQRIYDPQKKQWHVWYFIGQGFYYAGEWIGGADGDRLVLEKQNEKMGDRLVLSRLEFSDISDAGFKWRSINVDNETGEEFVDWEITCRREH